jgi:hypothetical protein
VDCGQRREDGDESDCGEEAHGRVGFCRLVGLVAPKPGARPVSQQRGS